MKFKQIFAIILVALAAIIAIQNSSYVETNILMFSLKMPRIVLILCVFSLGFISGKLIRLKKK